jgi:hypothetical protein
MNSILFNFFLKILNKNFRPVLLCSFRLDNDLQDFDLG